MIGGALTKVIKRLCAFYSLLGFSHSSSNYLWRLLGIGPRFRALIIYVGATSTFFAYYLFDWSHLIRHLVTHTFVL